MVSSASARGLAFQRGASGTMRDKIERITEDLKEVKDILPITVSTKRNRRLQQFLHCELESLRSEPFDHYDQEGKVDFLLLKNYLERQLRELELNAKKDAKAKPLLPLAERIVDICEARAAVLPIIPQNTARELFEVQKQIEGVIDDVDRRSGPDCIDKSSAFRAARTVDSLRGHLNEWFSFYNGYDPLFSWWVPHPYGEVDRSLKDISSIIKERLVGIDAGDGDAIVGDPIGHDGLVAELEAEMVPYTPEEIISIGEKEFDWCINELKLASRSMGFADNWHQALEEVKNEYVEPGKQTQLVRDLALEAISFVEDSKLVTVPSVAKETW